MIPARGRALVAGAVAVAAALAGCGGKGGPPEVAARVDGTAISSDKTEELARLMAEGDAIRAEVEKGDLDKKHVEQVVLAYLIRLTYLEKVAEKMGIAGDVDPQEAQAVAELPPDAFTARGWGAGDLEAALKATRLSKAIAHEVFPSPGVSEEDLLRQYEQNAEQFRNYWHAEARVAFFKAEDPAGNMKARVAGGQSFADAAAALGAEQEGSLGEVTPDAPLGKPILDVIGVLAPGAVSDPIAAGGGWFVATVIRRVNTPARSFEEVRSDLVALHADNRRRELFYAWLGKQLAKADVEVDSYYGQWNPQTLEVG